jgi:N-acetyl-alpha-D-muramate 1-phosphate uridylyltransferase
MMPVVVLSGGLATRLFPITEKIPKSLIEINGIPFVLHQLDLFRRQGINHVHYCLGHLGEMVRPVIESSTQFENMKISYSFDGKTLLGTGGAVKKALSNLPDHFFITYGDSYLNINYQRVESFFKAKADTSDGLMTVYLNDDKFDTSNVVYKNNRVDFYSKKKRLPEMSYIDFGLGILNKKHFSTYPVDRIFDLSDIYEKLSIDKKLIGFEVTERFYEIGSLKGIEDLTNYLK